jgi:ectoine hydroxylase-related dioxygenase (phytanoyl-CoA dioxygenase family)
MTAQPIRPALTPEQITEFFEVGFLVQPDVFSPEEVERMRVAFERLRRTAYRLGHTCDHAGSRFVLQPLHDAPASSPGVRIDRIVWCGAAEPVLSAFGCDQRLVAMAACLLGATEMNQLINQAHFKYPGDGVEFPWHQDSTHRRYGGDEWRDVNGRGSYVQTVTALDGIDEENGSLELIPGSCALGHVPPPAGVEGWLPIPPLDPGAAVTVTMRPGSVLAFGPYVFHRSLPNRSERPRRVFINGFAYPGANTRVYPGRGAGRLVRCR